MASSYTRLACSRHPETTFHRERARCSAIRTSATQNCPISCLILQHAQLVRAVTKGADKGHVKSDHIGLSTLGLMHDGEFLDVLTPKPHAIRKPFQGES
jgi:hypothetical protein